MKSFKESELKILPSGNFELLGSKCLDCGEVLFGRHIHCLNCSSPKLEGITLSRWGKLVNYTVLYVPPFQEWKGPIPYVIAVVELPEGPEVTTRLVGVNPDNSKEIEIGMKVEFDLEEADKDEAGNTIMVYICRPTRG